MSIAKLKPGVEEINISCFRSGDIGEPLYPTPETRSLKTIDILALTAWVLDFDDKNGNGQRLINQLKKKCKIRLLLVSRLTYAFWSQHHEGIEQRFKQTQNNVEKFIKRAADEKVSHWIEIREHAWQPSVSMILLDATYDKGTGWITPFTPNPQSKSEDKYYFEVKHPSGVFTFYHEQFEQLWVEANPFKVQPTHQQLKDLYTLTSHLQRNAARLSGTRKDIAVIIALSEEFEYFIDAIDGDWRTSKSVHPLDQTGIYEITIGKKEVLLVLLGKMGKTNTAARVENLLGRYDVDILVNIGVTGGLKDVRLGDVVVASQVDDYMHRAKVKDGSDEQELAWGGVVYRSTPELVKRVMGFEFSHPDQYEQWVESGREEIQKIVDSASLDTKKQEKLFHKKRPHQVMLSPRIWADDAHIASGDIVVTSKSFQKQLTSRDRNLMAVEMESVGMLTAVQENSRSARTLILRGISDLADGEKGELEERIGMDVRRVAMQNAARLLKSLIECGTLFEI